MSNLLIGSSNVYRHYKAANFPNVRKFKMVNCTKMSGFEAYMQTLSSDSTSVLISVFENFMVDAVGADTVEPESTIDRCIKDFLGTILSAAVRMPNTKFGIVMPMGRPALPWYQERVEPITSFLNDGIRAMISDRSINNVSSIQCSHHTSQHFDTDNVHLTATSAKDFLEFVLDAAEVFFKAPMVDLTEPGELTPDQIQIKHLEDRLNYLENTLRAQADKNVGNDLMFARSREETDATTNKAKEDRLVINGLKSPTPLPSDPRLKIEALKGMANVIFENLIPGFKGKIIYLTQAKNPGGQPIPMVEIKMEAPEQALEIRKAYAEKRKNKMLGKDLESLFISNCVSLATRVRVDVMKAIARRLTNREDLAYVAGFTSRPMMHIRKAGPPTPTTRPLKSFSYIDSVTRFGHLVNVEDLETAYGRAGRSFNGQLQQNFVVLNERDQIQLQSVSKPGRAPPTVSSEGGGTILGTRGSAAGGGKKVSRGPDLNWRRTSTRNNSFIIIVSYVLQ